MNHMRYRAPVSIALLAASALIAGCQHPLSTRDAKTERTQDAAISVKLRPVSPAISSWLEQLNIQASSSASMKDARLASAARAPRAYLAANRAHFTLYDSSEEVLTTWDVSIGGDALTQFNIDYSSIDLALPDKPIVAGIDYTLKAEVFNDATSASAPVVVGTSAAFTVPAGTAPVQVPITCLPLDPTPLTADGTPTSTLLSPWEITDTDVLSTGTERWYTLDLSTTLDWVFTATPETGLAAYFLFDAAGNFVGLGGTGTQSHSLPATGLYYLGFIAAVVSPGDLSPQNVELSVQPQPPDPPALGASIATPNYNLTDQAIVIDWGGPATGQSYKVRRDIDLSFGNPIDVTSASNSAGTNSYSYDGSEDFNFTDYTAQLGQTYYYQVAAVDTATGMQSAYSYAVHLTPSPANVVASYGGSNNILLSWDPVTGADAYSIQLLDSTGQLISDGFILFTTNSVDLPTSFLANGSTNYFIVQAHVGLWGSWSISNPVVYEGSAP